MFWRIFYTVIVVPFGWILAQLLGLFDRKAARGIRGRKGLIPRLREDIRRLDAAPRRGRIWFHSSSMGEFEQAKPIIAELKKRYPDLQIVASFFSPSGYEHSQSYKLADIITYIPFDTRANAKEFVRLISPSAAIIVRYDVWPNHLWALQRAGIPTFIANATLRPTTSRKLPALRQFHRELYNSLDYILTVSEDDRNVFESFHLTHPVIATVGDTRYDQVWVRSRESKNRKVLDPKIILDKKVLVIGSSWREDEDVLLPACVGLLKQHPELLVILVPHEPTVETLDRIEDHLNGDLTSIRFSSLGQFRGERLILIDSVGILMSLYHYASIAYVGGSFRSGIHNVLEPAAHGIPVVFGPIHQNSQEAMELVRVGGAFVGSNQQELHRHLQGLLENESARVLAGEHALDLVRQNTGATDRFISYLEKKSPNLIKP